MCVLYSNLQRRGHDPWFRKFDADLQLLWVLGDGRQKLLLQVGSILPVEFNGCAFKTIVVDDDLRSKVSLMLRSLAASQASLVKVLVAVRVAWELFGGIGVRLLACCGILGSLFLKVDFRWSRSGIIHLGGFS
ncbi:hypothetical protein TNIN_427831 [Trichonephila inaurata madagascariensis]|uniref:Uncharacterized protein n=1 Tax=Trichonephila inaurata madagascariensis TaxID=2747483 RepID=A0A8X6IBC6_9ARAC|nr:hypothetical protein TNIN_427831 [Trichonephila inaurata madagascariensis]